MIGPQSQPHVAQRHKTSHQQPRGNQQRQRKPHFQHHQRIAQSSVAESAADSFAAIAQRFVHVLAYRLQRRNQSKYQRGQHPYAQSKQPHPRIQLDHGFGRNNVLRHQGYQRLQPSPCQECPYRRAAHRQDQAFYQQLTKQSPAVRAQRGADRELLLPGRRAGQQQIRDVAAPNQQQQSHRGQYNEKSSLELAHHEVRQRLQVHGEMLWIILGVHFCQPVGHDRKVRFRFLH